MTIPPVSIAVLHSAMAHFDKELLDTPEWADWQTNRAHHYAIVHDGQRYPVKQIVTMATRAPVSDFSGGKSTGQANAYVSSRGIKVVELLTSAQSIVGPR